ncbi:DUF2306 domain-containing protein [Spirosoma rhododendri]|uniref:DUF2306 domain-containing protein n=1 Tax=Spirosoma rhododendri TaxID=2728024 RepID=A0A7L5DMN6_9BACT|nr:DUF2306 domain-containing protein [Spirosoma rhododendri]QJD79709.1 DUF2306 domain-containing protein [Spirosoma rhododendri]
MTLSTIGLVHLIAAFVALLTGTLIFFINKGGLLHRRIGYGYVVSMLVLNLSAFMIYRLFGKFGPFHVMALFSTASILGGMVPALFRHRVRNWLQWHYYFMNWSVVGLYAAFWAETFTRTLPMGQFWPIVVGATVTTTTVGAILIRRNAARFLSVVRKKALV